MSLTTLDAIRRAKAQLNADSDTSEKIEDTTKKLEENPPVTETVVDTDTAESGQNEPVNEDIESDASDDELSKWKEKYKELEAKMLRQQEASARQIETVKKSSGQQLLAQQNINEALSKEVEHWKKQAKSQDEFDFKNDNFGNIFKFAGSNVMFGVAWEDPLSTLNTKGRRLDVHPSAFLPAFDLVLHLTGRKVTVDKSGYAVEVKADNLLLRGVNESKNLRGISFFVMMAFAYQFDLDRLVQFAWYWVRATHTELASKPSAIRELVQGSEKNGSKAYDFYLLVLAYRDLCLERQKRELSENELVTQLYELRDRVEKHTDISRDIRKRVLTDELLTSLLVGRELGIHNHPLRSGLLPKDLREYLASRLPDTEVEIARTIMHEAQEYADEVSRRDAKAGK